eukprot:7134413-Pyramimonas_sp.AAC.1
MQWQLATASQHVKANIRWLRNKKREGIGTVSNPGEVMPSTGPPNDTTNMQFIESQECRQVVDGKRVNVIIDVYIPRTHDQKCRTGEVRGASSELITNTDLDDLTEAEQGELALDSAMID